MSDMLSDLYPNAMYLPVNRFNALIRTGESCRKTLLAQNPRFPCMQNHWQMCLPKSISAVPQKELFWSSPTLSLLALSCGSSPLLNRISCLPSRYIREFATHATNGPCNLTLLTPGRHPAELLHSHEHYRPGSSGKLPYQSIPQVIILLGPAHCLFMQEASVAATKIDQRHIASLLACARKCH